MSHTLAQQQTALLDALHHNATNLIAFSSDSMPANGHFCLKNTPSTWRGLRAYRANAQALSSNALQTCYPVLQQMIGAENFEHLAYDLWQAKPPQRGDLAQWGSELADYLQQVPQLQTLLTEHAYLQDVARVEWALHVAATATDAALDAQSFQRLTQADPGQLRLLLGPGCVVWRSSYPVVAILQLHDDQPQLHGAAHQAIAAGEAQIALIYRRGLRPMLMPIHAASAALIEATLQGGSLAAAVDAALAQAPDFDFSTYLSEGVQIGLLLGVE